ncbi:MAG: type I-B CRISPR-associated protein Cas5b [Candidatus Saccharicenans sp.]
MNGNAGYILRVRIYQPQAHYRVPFTYQRRHTYPIPPYSTVIGFFCNLLGFDGMPAEHNDLKRIKISIAGRFESKTTEYIWFRNLAKDAHVGRFGTVENRSIGGHIEHIGGQSPVSIDVLNEVRLVIYLAHEDETFINYIRSSVQNPARRLEILHLGRAEDWIVIEELSQVCQLSQFDIKRVDANFGHFFWIPERIYQPNSKDSLAKFEQFEGLLYRLPTFWTVEDYDKTLNRHGRRIFDYITAKLSDGLFTQKHFLFDEECKLPIFLADFAGEK